MLTIALFSFPVVLNRHLQNEPCISTMGEGMHLSRGPNSIAIVSNLLDPEQGRYPVEVSKELGSKNEQV
jgi:hypothetical protein